MRVLVTGGAGFIASHVVDAALEAGHRVRVMDLARSAKGESFQGDMANLEDCLEATKGIDGVCHLAGVGDVYLAMREPWTAATRNVLATANLMEACLRNGVKRVVYTSTWEVYGKPYYEPVDEEHPCNPDHFYNITKLAGERIALAYNELKGMPAIALRLGTAYGTRMRPNTVFAIFITRAMKGEPIIIKGSGEQFRQFTHTSDIARAFLTALASNLHGESFNIISPEKVSINRLAQLVTKRLPTAVVHEEQRAGEIMPAYISPEKARRSLGWEAQVEFEDGLSELIDYYLAQGQAKAS